MASLPQSLGRGPREMRQQPRQRTIPFDGLHLPEAALVFLDFDTGFQSDETYGIDWAVW